MVTSIEAKVRRSRTRLVLAITASFLLVGAGQEALAENEPAAVAKRATARTRHFNVLLGIYISSLKEFEHKYPRRMKQRR